MLNKLAKSIIDTIESFMIAQKYWVHDLGEGMVLYSHQDTKEKLLLNQATGRKIKLVDDFGSVVHITERDIDFERVGRLENNYNAARLWSRYYYGVEPYRNGIAMVTWTLYPEGRYFEDEDGFGGEDCLETNIYGFMDKEGKIIVPFRDLESHEFGIWHDKAENLLNEISHRPVFL
ncbi:MAG: hypothetical protein ACOYVK_21320 [Bacillota bacterium]